MTRKTLLAATVMAATAIGGVAIADSNHGHGGKSGMSDRAGMMQGDSGMMGNMGGMSNMMGMMQRMHGQMMGGDMMGSAAGPMGFGMTGGQFGEAFDADGNGTVTPEELRAGLAAQLKQYDSDGDGSLSIAEFEALHNAMTRNFMVDRFQALDEDGDGRITGDEMAAPANWMERMQMMRSQAPVASGEQMPMSQGNGAGNGTMMNGN